MLEMTNLSVNGRLAPLNWHCAAPGLIALIGPNGSGKSTLLAALANLIPAHGQVRLQQHSLLELEMLDAARLRAMLPQRSQTQISIACHEVIRLGSSMLAVNEAQLSPVLMQLVTRLELMPLLARDFCHLSGGEQQRVLLAKTLLQVWPSLNPRGCLLLLDEPLAGLDWHHQLQLLQTLRELVALGVLVIFSVHDFNLALAHADGLLCLQEGQLVAQGTVSVLDAALLARVFQIRTERLSHEGRSFFIPSGLISGA